MAETETRPMRMCDVCGAVDDHPRHVYAHGPDDGVVTPDSAASAALNNAKDEDTRAAVFAHIRDNSTAMRHMDCCREQGCPDGTCDTVTAGAENLRGMELVEHIQANFSAPAEEQTDPNVEE